MYQPAARVVSVLLKGQCIMRQNCHFAFLVVTVILYIVVGMFVFHMKKKHEE
jgi:uncharacterized membrane protein SirB2